MAGTTNVQQWNPTAANQETDAQYLADSQRAGGATNPSVFDATLANKLFYQVTTYLDALFTAFANKGFTTSDSNLSTLTAECANFLTTADVLPAVQVVAYAASLTLNAAAANGFYVTAMTGNLTITAVNGLTSGQLVVLYYQQDAVGGRTVTFPATMVGAQQPDPAASSVSAQLFGYDSATSKLRAIGPLVSNNGTFVSGTLSAAALTLSSGAPNGYVLTGNGTTFAPAAPPVTRGAHVTNVNGNYYQWSDGVIEAWGSVSVPANGSTFNTAPITFPVAFTQNPSITITTVGQASNSGDPTTPPDVQLQTLSTTGATAFMARTIVASAGGGHFDNTITLNWRAIGV